MTRRRTILTNTRASKGPSARTNKSRPRVDGSCPPRDQPWTWLTREMLKSAAYRALSRPALQILARLCIEHMNHGGRDNGSLICTHDQFATHGVRRSSIAASLRELEAMGWIGILKGYAYKGNHEPSRYRLTWLSDQDGKAATNEWRKTTDDDVRKFKAEKSRVQRAKAARAGILGSAANSNDPSSPGNPARKQA